MKTAVRRIFARPKVRAGLVVLFIALTIVVDQALKAWATGLLFPIDFLCFRFFPYGNHGIFGGYLAGLDPWIIRIFFSVLFGFLTLGISLGLYLLRPKRAPLFKAGLVVYAAGIFGNVWDRMTTGTVVDYVVIRVPGLSGMAFNFADAVVFVGAIFIAVALFREADALWYARNQRQGYWVEPEFQRDFAILFALLGFAHFFVIALYSFVFLKVYAVGGVQPLGGDRVIRDYLFGLGVIEGAALLLTVAGSILFSHRLIGPLVAFAQFVERRKQAGDSPPPPRFRARQSDYFKKILEAIADRLE
jgi:signal peptidase II